MLIEQTKCSSTREASGGKPSKREHAYSFLHPDSVAKIICMSCSTECKKRADQRSAKPSEASKLSKTTGISDGPDEFDLRRMHRDMLREFNN